MIKVLSRREKQVADLVASGLSNREIGIMLGITDKTAKNHVYSIMRKWGLSSRVQVAIVAFKSGILTVDEAHATMVAMPDRNEAEALEPQPQ